MSKYCSVLPKQGQEVFKKLKSKFGYDTAYRVFFTSMSPKFQRKYGNTLILDDEGVPSYDSMMKIPYIQELIGTGKVLQSLNTEYGKAKEDNLVNYKDLLSQAYAFNTQHNLKDNYVAVVEAVGINKIGIVIKERTAGTESQANNQYSSFLLNERLVSIFQPLGLTINMLSDAEMGNGVIGVTDFSQAKKIGRDFASIIKVANNIQGAQAISEEFSHLLIGMFRDRPLIQRAINVLKNNPEAVKKILGDSFDNYNNVYNGDTEMLAEEALGHILQNNLLRFQESGLPSTQLFKRTVDNTVQQFRNYDLAKVEQAIVDANAAMGTLAKDILSGTIQPTEEQILASRRNAQFNALSESIERRTKILREAVLTEAKKIKIISNETGKKKAIQNVKDLAIRLTGKEQDTILGLLGYARSVLLDLRGIHKGFQSFDEKDSKAKFAFLRAARASFKSYIPFIDAMTQEQILDPNISDFKIIDEDGSEISLGQVLKSLQSASKFLENEFALKAKPTFISFMKSFLGEDFKVQSKDGTFVPVDFNTLLTELNGDISYFDMWLDSMAESGDLLLQLMNKIVMKAKDAIRLKSIEDIRRVQSFRIKWEKAGITSFDFMYERTSDGKLTGNYIAPVNWGAFNADFQKFKQYLRDKYGDKRTKERESELEAWLNDHTTGFIGGEYVPNVENHPEYRNAEYYNLSEQQRQCLKEFLDLKREFDRKLPKNRANNLKAIQMRRSSSQRLLDTLASPTQLFQNIKESVSKAFTIKEDDYEMKDKSVQIDFEGNEFMQLPVVYTRRLSNPTEISTDAVGSLMAYIYMANNYEEMEKIVNPMEVGRTIIKEGRKVKATSAGRLLTEKLYGGGVEGKKQVYVQNPKTNQKLDHFFNTQIYGRYYQDSGTAKVFGKPVDINKATSLLLKVSSLAQLGFAWLANTANVVTGTFMANIEAASGEFFGFSEMAKADAQYASEILGFIAELPNRLKTNKLALFCEYFDTKKTFSKNLKDNIQKKSWITRLLGVDLAFLGQECGDHWLYNRVAIAMALRKKVLYKGQEMSLWEALKVEQDPNDETGEVKKLNVEDITELDGSPLDAGQFSREISEVNQSLYGIYNDEDMNKANTVALGRLLQQYRKWMKAQFNRRFEAGRVSGYSGKWREGYYRTLARVSWNLLKGQYNILALGSELKDYEKRNLRRVITELAQFIAVWALANFVDFGGGDDDKKRPWAQKFAEYMAQRELHELGNLVPSPIMFEEMGKTITNPIPSVSVLQQSLALITNCFTPWTWDDTIESGVWEGHSWIYKRFMKAPIPGIRQITTIKGMIEELDEKTLYYSRNTY